MYSQYDQKTTLSVLRQKIRCVWPFRPPNPHLPPLYFAYRSQRIPEPNQPLNRLPTSLSTLIRPDKLELQRKRDANDQRTSDHAGPDTGLISRLVLCAKDGTTDNTTDAAEADERG